MLMMKLLEKKLRSWLIKELLKDFELTEHKLSQGTLAAAMNDVYTSVAMRKYLNISIANYIRRSLYVTDMEKHAYFGGAIAALRKIQNDAEAWKNSGGKLPEEVTSDQKLDEV